MLNGDLRFEYTWHYDLVGSWTVGTYRIGNDTVYLINTPIYDTVRFVGQNGRRFDSLVLSDDRKPERMTSEAFAGRPFYGYIQDGNRFPKVLVWRKGRLYTVNENGKLDTRKRKSWQTGKKYPPWYVFEGQ
jgi:hypothetical protein